MNKISLIYEIACSKFLYPWWFLVVSTMSAKSFTLFSIDFMRNMLRTLMLLSLFSTVVFRSFSFFRGLNLSGIHIVTISLFPSMLPFPSFPVFSVLLLFCLPLDRIQNSIAVHLRNILRSNFLHAYMVKFWLLNWSNGYKWTETDSLVTKGKRRSLLRDNHNCGEQLWVPFQ